MKHDLIAESRNSENFSRAAATGKVLSHYDVRSKIAQHLQVQIYLLANNKQILEINKKNLPKYCQCYSNLNSNKELPV